MLHYQQDVPVQHTTFSTSGQLTPVLFIDALASVDEGAEALSRNFSQFLLDYEAFFLL